jgi:hypothetical protein
MQLAARLAGSGRVRLGRFRSHTAGRELAHVSRCAASPCPEGLLWEAVESPPPMEWIPTIVLLTEFQ